MEAVDNVESLVRDHLPLVKREVGRLMRRVPPHVDRDDLTSVGMIALVVCAQGYLAERGVPFAHLARIRIRWALLDQLRSLDWASRSVRSRARQVDCVQEELISALGRTPTSAELAGTLGVPVHEVAAAVGDVQRAAVLSLQGGTCEPLGFLVSGQAPSPEDLTLLREQIDYLHDAIAVLPDRLRTVVVRCFFDERPMAETGAELGISESRVSQLRTEALHLLRDGLNSQLNPGLLAEQRSDGCVARRRQAYYAEIASRRDLRSRLATRPVLGVA